MKNKEQRFISVTDALGKLYKSKCPECGNVDNLTKKETQRTVHCQTCYKHYEFKGE